jgi:hypothetical protein
MRHSIATHLLDAGQPIEFVKDPILDIGPWSRLWSTQRYPIDADPRDTETRAIAGDLTRDERTTERLSLKRVRLTPIRHRLSKIVRASPADQKLLRRELPGSYRLRFALSGLERKALEAVAIAEER